MATYGKTTMTTYKGTSDEVLVLCGDNEINEYFLNNIITATGSYIFCVWYKSDEDAEITFNVFGEEETVESTEVWHKYVKRIDVETLVNNDISITVTPEINTFFYEAFCVNGKADTSWYPSDLDIDEYAKTATNYITEINNGIWVTPANARPDTGGSPTATTSGWRLAEALELFKNGVSHFKVWLDGTVAKIRVGIESAGHLLLQPSMIQLKSNADTVMAQFQAPEEISDTLSDHYNCDGSEQMTVGRVICSVSIPLNCEVTGIEGSFTDELFTIYTISESAVYNSSDPNTWFIYQQTSGAVTVKANGTFSFTFNTIVSLSVHVDTTVSHNYIGAYPDSPEDNLFTIGNGMSANEPSNAMTMDWQGNIDLPDGYIHGKQNILWSGGYYMTSGHIARLSEPISAQSNGIVLLWSAYVSGDQSPIKNVHWVSYFIPRNFVQPPYEGGGFGIPLVASNFSNIGMKYVYVYDNRIVGNDDNSATGTASGITYKNNHWVLRFVIGV